MCVKTDQRCVSLSFINIKGICFFLAALLICLSSCNDPKKITASEGESPSEKKVGSVYQITPEITGNIPTKVNLPNPDNLSDVDNRPFFDEFSWQMFIAMSWPVESGQRGVPLNPNNSSTFLNMTNTTPLVWTSYKNQYDLFGTDNPTPWNSSNAPVSPGGGNTNHVMLGSINAKSVIHGEVDESFSVPLIDQNKNYALFEIRYNEVQYDFIYNNQLYLKSKLVQYQMAHGDTVAMPENNGNQQGSILAKAAWRQFESGEDASNYYVVDQLVYDPVSGKDTIMKLGLVGFHIAQKLDEFPEWIWSSFEHVDNVPPMPASQAPTAEPPYTFNNGSDPNIPSTGDRGYANKPDSTGINHDKNSRVPVQVTRLNAIPTTPSGNSTVDLNALYQAAVGDTWMKNYQLVITQWPTNPGQFKQSSQGGVYPQDCGQAFPINGAANTTMETYFQSQSDAAGSGGNSCMACHYKANNMDFSWSLFLRSH